MQDARSSPISGPGGRTSHPATIKRAASHRGGAEPADVPPVRAGRDCLIPGRALSNPDLHDSEAE